MTKKRLYSGIQPSGALHLGNYLGAIKRWVELQEEYDCIFGIVDYHAITVPYEEKLLPQRTKELVIGLLAAGVDPDKCTIYLQSDVPYHTELSWIFSTFTPLGLLERMTQFKDKSTQHEKSINLGLLAYPVLQAADILLYKGALVPVGEDQEQHLELSREIARKFNNRYGKTFDEPQTLLSPASRIIGLDGQSKMSKSKGNTIELLESPKSVEKKLRRAITDPQRKLRTDSGDPELCNIFMLHKALSPEETQNPCAEGCRSAAIGCVDCKMALLENLEKVLQPIREKAEELSHQEGLVESVLEKGKTRCLEIASNTMREVRKKVGFLHA